MSKEKAVSTHPYTPLSAINKDRIDWKIQVRLCRKWKTATNGKIPENLEFLFVDIQGTRIQGTVKKMWIDKFDRLLNEGDICIVIQFSVLDRAKTFPVTEHPYRIMFHSNTSISITQHSEFPKSVFNFKKFLDILDGSQKDDVPLFDVIGVVVDINDSKMRSDGSVKGNKNIQLLIEDVDNLKLQCILWEPYCHEIAPFVELVRKKKDYHVVVVQLCRAKIFRGEVGISNTFHATKVIVDQNLEEIIEFKSRLPIYAAENSFDGSKLSTSSFLSVKDDLQNPKSIFVSLNELKTSEQPLKAWVVASIAEILYDRGWSYTSCLKCKRKVKQKDSKLFCDWCDDFVIGHDRYKIHIIVVDGSANAIFLLWNDVAMSMIDKSAAEVWDSMIQDTTVVEDVARNQVPIFVDSLIGKEYLFKVSVESKHLEGKDSVYVVERYSDDKDMIKAHKKVNHKIIGCAPNKCQDSVGDTNWTEEDYESHGGLLKTPELEKNGKRCLDFSLNDGDESSTKKMNKTEKID